MTATLELSVFKMLPYSSYKIRDTLDVIRFPETSGVSISKTIPSVIPRAVAACVLSIAKFLLEAPVLICIYTGYEL